MNQYVYSPHYDFYINKAQRDHGYSMTSFHMHKKYEIYYQISGSRRYVIENGTYFINAGSLVLIDKTEIHKTVCVNDDLYARYVLNFSESYISGLAGGLEGVDLLACFRGEEKVLALTLKQRAVVEGLLGRMDAAKEALSDWENALRKLNLCELLLVINQYVEAQPKRSMESSKVLNRVVCDITNYVSSHYREELSLAVIADSLRLSPSYVSRVFKRETGTGLMEYVSMVRLRAAKELLETTRLSVSEIAETAGFATTGHFTVKFREACGIPPSKYRRQYAVTP